VNDKSEKNIFKNFSKDGNTGNKTAFNPTDGA